MKTLDKSIRWMAVVFLLVSIVGVVDATYLTVKHYEGSSVQCFIIDGCDIVLGSNYAEIFGMPTALAGLIYYFLIFALSLFYLYNKKIVLMKLAFYLPVMGFLFSLWLVYLQAFVLNSLCFYCIISALLTTVLFVVSILGLVQLKEEND